MNITRFTEIKAMLAAAFEIDSRDANGEFDPMRTCDVEFQKVLAQIGEVEFQTYVAAVDDLKSFDLNLSLPDLRKAICEHFSGLAITPTLRIYERAELIFSAAGVPDAQAWDMGHLGIFVGTKPGGYCSQSEVS